MNFNLSIDCDHWTKPDAQMVWWTVVSETAVPADESEFLTYVEEALELGDGEIIDWSPVDESRTVWEIVTER